MLSGLDDDENAVLHSDQQYDFGGQGNFMTDYSTENLILSEGDYDYAKDVDSVLPSSNLPDDDKVTKWGGQQLKNVMLLSTIKMYINSWCRIITFAFDVTTIHIYIKEKLRYLDE